MRSSELAQMAGVTVRTLRHYHKLGLLPEPARRENGYREYLVSDAARLMRIKNLASLGFSLERIKAMLDAEDAERAAGEIPGAQTGSRTDAHADAETGALATAPATARACEGGQPDTVRRALDELDAELKRRIADLQQQRRVIAQLRAEGSTPDVSPANSRFLAAYASCEPDPKLIHFEKSTLALSESLLSPSSMSLLTDFQSILMEEGLVGAYADINRRILTMPSDADEAFKRAILDDALALFGPIVERLDLLSAKDSDDGFADELLESYDREQHPPEQVALIERLEEEIIAHIEHLYGDESVAPSKNSRSALDPDLTS